MYGLVASCNDVAKSSFDRFLIDFFIGLDIVNNVVTNARLAFTL